MITTGILVVLTRLRGRHILDLQLRLTNMQAGMQGMHELIAELDDKFIVHQHGHCEARWVEEMPVITDPSTLPGRVEIQDDDVHFDDVGGETIEDIIAEGERRLEDYARSLENPPEQ